MTTSPNDEGGLNTRTSYPIIALSCSQIHGMKTFQSSVGPQCYPGTGLSRIPHWLWPRPVKQLNLKESQLSASRCKAKSSASARSFKPVSGKGEKTFDVIRQVAEDAINELVHDAE